MIKATPIVSSFATSSRRHGVCLGCQSSRGCPHQLVLAALRTACSPSYLGNRNMHLAGLEVWRTRHAPSWRLWLPFSNHGLLFRDTQLCRAPSAMTDCTSAPTIVNPREMGEVKTPTHAMPCLENRPFFSSSPFFSRGPWPDGSGPLTQVRG